MQPVEHTHQLSILNKVNRHGREGALSTSDSLAMQQHIEVNEVTMRDDESQEGPSAPVGLPSEEAIVTSHPAGDDAPLIMLEGQFNALMAELTTAQRANREICPGRRSLIQPGARTDVDAAMDPEARTRQEEAILARLHPIEQAIMATPARTVAGLGVKARHAAYVMSQCWSESIDKIDWEARAIRLLIEAVCNVAHQPLLPKDVTDQILDLNK
jgi:hypothetical protein